MRGCLTTQYEFHPKFDNSVVEFPGIADEDLIVYTFDKGRCIRLDALLDTLFYIRMHAGQAILLMIQLFDKCLLLMNQNIINENLQQNNVWILLHDYVQLDIAFTKPKYYITITGCRMQQQITEKMKLDMYKRVTQIISEILERFDRFQSNDNKNKQKVQEDRHNLVQFLQNCINNCNNEQDYLKFKQQLDQIVKSKEFDKETQRLTTIDVENDGRYSVRNSRGHFAADCLSQYYPKLKNQFINTEIVIASLVRAKSMSLILPKILEEVYNFWIYFSFKSDTITAANQTISYKIDQVQQNKKQFIVAAIDKIETQMLEKLNDIFKNPQRLDNDQVDQLMNEFNRELVQKIKAEGYMNSFQQYDGFLANRNKILEDLQVKVFKSKILPEIKKLYYAKLSNLISTNITSKLW